MKKLKKSFLFFYFPITCLVCVFSSSISAQQATDSASYYREKILNPQNSTDLTSAYAYYENRIKENLKLRDTISAIRNLRYFAINQFNLGLLYECEESTIKAFSLVDKLEKNDTTNEIKKALYNQLGKVYRGLYNYDKALEYYNRALEFAINSNDSILLLNNKANIYRDQFKNELALSELELVYKKRLALGDKGELARSLDNLAFIQSKLKHPNALTNMLSALKIRLDLNDTKGLFSSYRHLTYYYLDREMKEQASFYANKSYETAKSLNSVSYMQEARTLFITLNDDPNVIEYKRVEDSISKAKQLRENKFASYKYDIEKEQRRTQEAEQLREEQELETAQQRFQKTIYLFGLSVLFLAGGFLIYSLRQRHKKEKLQEAYNTETRISKKVHDEVANDVSGLMSFVQNMLQVPETIKTLLLNALENIYLRTRDISSETGTIELEDFGLGLRNLLIQYNSKDTRIITNQLATIPWEQIADHKKIAVYRSLQELMVNMAKHSEATKVSIAFKNDGKQHIIRYTDNGKGASSKDLVFKGLGHVENRMQNIGGTFSFETSQGKGFMASLIFTS